MEENSNIQEEVKTEIKQENNQDDEIEILEIEEVKEKKDFSNVLSGIFKNKKIYNGTVMVINKPLPQVSTMTLNSLSFEVGSNLPVDVSSYIKEQLSDEVKAAIILDTSNVDTNKPGSYLYSVSYNGKLYTNTITIYEPKFGVSTDNSLTNSNKEKVTDNNTNNN